MSRRAVILGEVGLAVWRERHARGEVQGTSPFGVDALEGSGFDLRSPSPRPGRWRRKVRDVVEHRTGAKVEVPLAAARDAAGADVVLALLEQFAVLPAALRRTGLPPYSRPALIALTCWLADDLQGVEGEQARRLVARYAPADLLLVLSRHQVPLLVAAGFAEHQVRSIPFGIEHRFFTPPEDPAVRDIEVLAVGQDRGRDYGTLFRAVADTGIATQVVCRPENLTGLRVPAEVRHVPPVPVTAYRDLLRRAKVVVVPTHELAYPTGQTVALEAMASGAAVVATGTVPMREYLTDGHDALLVDVGDDRAMAAAIQHLLSSPEHRRGLGRRARATVEAAYTVEHMWRAAAAEIERVLDRRRR